MGAGGGQSKKFKSVSPHSFLYTTRANISHERIEQIRVCACSTPAYKGVAGVHEVCTLTQPRRTISCRIGMAQSKVKQTPLHFRLHFCLFLQSDGSLDMFAQEGV